MKLDDLKNETTPTPLGEGDLIDSMPEGGLGGVFSESEMTQKTILPTDAGKEALPTDNPFVAEAMDTMDVALTGLAVECAQLAEIGANARENGEEITINSPILETNPNSEAERAKRNSEFIPGVTVSNNNESSAQPAPEAAPAPANTTESVQPKETVQASKSDDDEDDDYGEDEWRPGAEASSEIPKLGIDKDDFADIDDDDEDEEESQEEPEDEDDFESRRKEFIDKCKQALSVIPKDDVIDISKMTISSKSMPASKASSYTMIPSTTESHALLATGKKITMTSLDATEIAQFNPEVLRQLDAISRNGYSNPKARKAAYSISMFTYFIGIVELIYNHIVSPKPSTYKEWAKTIYWADIDDLIFAAHKATYGKVGNILTYECEEEKCHEAWVEDKPVESMIAFDSSDKKWEKRYKDIMGLTGDTTLPHTTKKIQVSSNYIFELELPTIETFMQISSLEIEFAMKYIDLISIFQYVKNVFYIDRVNNQLVPVKFKEYPEDLKRTTKNKMKNLSEIITSSLTSDQIQTLVSATDELDRPADAMHYIYPEAECPKCKAKIKAVEAEAASILFSRYQLVDIANS